MTRLLASSAVLGALIAGGAWLATQSSARVSAIAGEPAAAVATAPVDWPICSTMSDLGNELDSAQFDPDFAAGKRALAIGNWDAAISALSLAVLRDPSDADLPSYIGFAHMRLGQFGPAMGAYQRALVLNPRHRGARRHLGELFLMLDEPGKAQEQLAALKEICLIACEETNQLERAIGSRALP